MRRITDMRKEDEVLRKDHHRVSWTEAHKSFHTKLKEEIMARRRELANPRAKNKRIIQKEIGELILISMRYSVASQVIRNLGTHARDARLPTWNRLGDLIVEAEDDLPNEPIPPARATAVVISGAIKRVLRGSGH